MSTINRSEFLSFKPKTQVATLPAGQVTVREPTAAEVVQFSQMQTSDPTHAPAWLVIRCAHDAAGNPMFAADDLQTVSDAPYTVLEPIVTAALDLAGLGAKATPPKA
jgi:hypothetical protein